MTANHAHTPDTAQVRFAATFPNENFSLKGSDFDRWLTAELAAAEQRGAERGWNEAVESLLEFEHINATVARWFKEDNPYRADQIEGDDANQGDWCYYEHCPYRGTGKMPTHRRHEHCPVWRTNA